MTNLCRKNSKNDYLFIHLFSSVLFYVAFVNFSLFLFFEENSGNRFPLSQLTLRQTSPRIDKKKQNFGIVERSRETQSKVKFKFKFKMAMLTDDEYKDFEAQIKLQEKVFLAISRIFQKFSGVYSLILLSWKAKWLGINFLVEISPKQTVLIGLFFFSRIWLGLPKFRLGTLRIREKINSESFGFPW